MLDPSTLPAAEQEAIRAEIRQLYINRGGDDIDAAIERDRKVLSEHRRELDYVSTLPFDKPYRWRIAPSVGLRAQKDLERQQKRQAELRDECMSRVLYRHEKLRANEAPQATSEEFDDLDAFFAVAAEAMKNMKQERPEDSPSTAAA